MPDNTDRTVTPQGVAGGWPGQSLGHPPTAPWTLALEGLVWAHRAVPDAARFHQPGLAPRRTFPVTLAGFARYHASPAGPYREVWGSPSLVLEGARLALAIPFMAVDSELSLRGGRANWGLPKEPGAFANAGWAASGERDGWSVRARVLSAGVRVPFAVAGRLLQAPAGGERLRAPATARGVGRPARVEVGGALPAWLAPGRHVGFLIERATLTVRAAS